MRDSVLKNYEVSELQTLIETIQEDMKKVQERNRNGQTPEFWSLVENVQKIRNELAIRGIKNPLPVQANFLE